MKIISKIPIASLQYDHNVPVFMYLVVMENILVEEQYLHSKDLFKVDGSGQTQYGVYI